MNTVAVEVKASHRFIPGKFFVPVLSLFFLLLPQHALAVSDTQFRQYIYDVCSIVPPPGWDSAAVASLNQSAFPGGTAGGPGGATNVSGNLGTGNAGGGLASRKKKGIRERLEEQKEKPAEGASADGGGWGILVTPQYGKADRVETDLENGYHSELAGLVVGLDYRFSDRFVLGGTVGQTRDKADFLNSAGSLKTRSNTFTLYGTWLPSESTAVDGYLGYGRINLDTQRHVSFGIISGPTFGSTTGDQVMAGMSASYQKDFGRVNLAPFFALDYIKTKFKDYSETGVYSLDPANPPFENGSSLLAMHYFERSTISFTSSLGARIGASYGYDWGTLLPSARLAAVHEFQNNAQQLRNELVITPGFGMSVATDAPDRNYLNLGLGVAAALNGGAQLFLDFDKRSQDRLLSSWAVSLGGLVEF